MKIAIVGTGVSGMVAAYLLHREHEITVFEAADYIGGHTNTHDVSMDGRTFAIDTGFIVFNDWTYPNFIALLKKLGVESQASDMSFSVKCEQTGLEYNGTSMNTLFSQRRNLLRPSFYRMIRDILHFNRESVELLSQPDPGPSLGAYLEANRYSSEFINHYIVPMGAAIWSTDHATMWGFPARYLVQFFKNHGMLSVNERPVWRVIKGGSQRYMERLIAPFRDRILLNAPVESVVRHSDSVELRLTQGGVGRTMRFDHVIIAAHSDQALSMLADPSPAEREVLDAIPYHDNEAVLHTDTSLLPRRKLAWAAWNYHLLRNQPDRAVVTYHMNRLQGLSASREFCVTLNHTQAIDPRKIIRRITYHHPVYSPAAVAAQKRHGEISGVNRTSYCGAYWGFGFHEDAVKSALAACKPFGKDLSS
ncbi:MAG: FAD-dependent oxidoreductase [Nitrospira sp.]|jgi:predicted NAD/FAD-binding protein|nr:MAG: FAD-dependent oxidoreductase [Nitrospira sp.]